MKGDFITIYQKARINSEYRQSQEAAAEFLCVSSRTLSDWENGKIEPPAKSVAKMADLYNMPQLCYEHLGRQISGVLPTLTIRSLPASVLVLEKEADDVIDVMRDLRHIAVDDEVDDNEAEQMNEIGIELMHLVGAALSLIYSAQRKRPGERPLIQAIG